LTTFTAILPFVGGSKGKGWVDYSMVRPQS
jgi:hypothetical protein